jgi:hypothetical protein
MRSCVTALRAEVACLTATVVFMMIIIRDGDHKHDVPPRKMSRHAFGDTLEAQLGATPGAGFFGATRLPDAIGTRDYSGRCTGILKAEDSEGHPLYAFGYGLSYSTFAYRAAKLSSSTLKAGDDLQVDVDVRNVSNRARRNPAREPDHQRT